MTSGRRSRQQRAAGLRTSALPPANVDGYHVVNEFKFQANRVALRGQRRLGRHRLGWQIKRPQGKLNRVGQPLQKWEVGDR